MRMLPAAVQRYIDRSTANGPWALAGAGRDDFIGAVVIPALAEGDSLFATLQSLAANPERELADFLIVIVVNHGESASDADRLQNRADLARLIDLSQQSRLNLAWVDAAGPGKEVPAKRAGVGFSRKLGMDLVLTRLDWSEDPLLVCLDADTLVEANYLQTLVGHFRQSALGAAVVPFRHQLGADLVQQEAIDRYELFLRSYVYGLRLAKSPYAFNSVGSAIACRASAYVRCGGMNSRKAGEDFYFLQKLAKTDGVGPLSGTTVYPEPRVSERVPFGTGRSMGRLLGGDNQAVLFYPDKVFRLLAEWLQLVAGALTEDAGVLLERARSLSPVLADFLEQADWLNSWPRLQTTHQGQSQRLQAFHAWFDGFRTMRLVHLLCDSGLCRGEPEELLPGYFAWGGEPCPETLKGMLEVLRLHDQG